MISIATQVEEARHRHGEDRIAIKRLAKHTLFAVADGAGGTSGGAAAADAICLALKTCAEAELENWSHWLSRLDQTMASSGSGGLAAVIVFLVSDEGVIKGASVGDCEAWIFGQGGTVDLTVHQVRKPLLGSGDASPVGFEARLSMGAMLVAATDGLWKYISHVRIAEQTIKRPLDALLGSLINALRLHSGALQDDVAIAACEVSCGEA